jgi:hypothetical protein
MIVIMHQTLKFFLGSNNDDEVNVNFKIACVGIS